MARKLSLAAAAKRIGINAETLRWRVRQGDGPPCIIIPGDDRDVYRIDEELLRRWMVKHTPRPRGRDGDRCEQPPAITRPLSLTQAAQRLGVNSETLRWRIRRGEGPPCLIIPGIRRDTYRIDADALERWIKQHTPSETPDRRRVRASARGRV